MFRALFFKEWIKLRLWWVLIAAANLGYALLLVAKLRRVIEVNSALMVWSAWLYKGYLFYRPYQYTPVVLGVLFATLQFLPEVQQQRIRLVLHLPVGEDKAVSAHLGAGLLLLAGCVIPAYLIFAATSAYYFPGEYQGVLLRTFLPWLLAGFGSYLVVAGSLLENNWWNRTLLLLVGFASLRLLLLERFYDSYSPILPPLLPWTALLFLLPLYSSLRYRKGLGR